MEAQTAVDQDALAVEALDGEQGGELIELRPGRRVEESSIGPAGSEEPRLDLDREAFDLARRMRADGAVALPLPRLPVSLPRVQWGEVARRAFDIAASSVLLVLLAPVLLAIAVAIRLDSKGPVLFRQRRLGRECEAFTIHKFRTMHNNADSRVHEEYMRRQISDGGEAAAVDNGKQIFKPWPDHRVTRVGAFLRKWSLDELPQLIDVLRGDMSLVGFRPPIDYEVECYPDWYYARFAVKPGITGLWQVSGRNERSYEEMVLLDIEYVERRSWRLDMLLLLKTFGVVVKRRGAY